MKAENGGGKPDREVNVIGSEIEKTFFNQTGDTRGNEQTYETDFPEMNLQSPIWPRTLTGSSETMRIVYRVAGHVPGARKYTRHPGCP